VLKLSRERIGHLSRLLVEALARKSSVRLLKDREAVRQSVMHALADEVRQDEERHGRVHARLSTGSLKLGSKAWDEEFRRLLDEEYDNEGFDSTG